MTLRKTRRSVYNNIYPGCSQGGFYSWSSNTNRQQQSNMAPSAFHRHVRMTDTYISRDGLGVNFHQDYCCTDPTVGTYTSQLTSLKQHHRSRDGESDREREVRLAVASVLSSANLNDTPVAEKTLIERVYNQILWVGDDHTIDKAGSYGEIHPEPHSLNNKNYLDNQGRDGHRNYQTSRDRMPIGLYQPTSGNPGFSRNGLSYIFLTISPLVFVSNYFQPPATLSLTSLYHLLPYGDFSA